MTLFDLPDELLLLIIANTSRQDKGRIAQVSRRMRSAADDYSHWNFMLKKDWQRFDEHGGAKFLFLFHPLSRQEEYLKIDRIGKAYARRLELEKEINAFTKDPRSTFNQKMTVTDPLIKDHILNERMTIAEAKSLSAIEVFNLKGRHIHEYIVSGYLTIDQAKDLRLVRNANFLYANEYINLTNDYVYQLIKTNKIAFNTAKYLSYVQLRELKLMYEDIQYDRLSVEDVIQFKSAMKPIKPRQRKLL